MTTSRSSPQTLALFHPIVRAWLERSFPALTPAQQTGWPVIASGASTLVCAPTGSGKTLTAFLWCLDRLVFGPTPQKSGCRVVYISPLKALAVDVEGNLRAPLQGIANLAAERGVAISTPSIAVRTGDTPPRVSRRSPFSGHSPRPREIPPGDAGDPLDTRLAGIPHQRLVPAGPELDAAVAAEASSRVERFPLPKNDSSRE